MNVLRQMKIMSDLTFTVNPDDFIPDVVMFNGKSYHAHNYQLLVDQIASSGFLIDVDIDTTNPKSSRDLMYHLMASQMHDGVKVDNVSTGLWMELKEAMDGVTLYVKDPLDVRFVDTCKYGVGVALMNASKDLVWFDHSAFDVDLMELDGDELRQLLLDYYRDTEVPMNTDIVNVNPRTIELMKLTLKDRDLTTRFIDDVRETDLTGGKFTIYLDYS